MSTVPAITDITSRIAAWTASGFIDAIRDHINADTTHLQIDAYTLNEGLTIGFQAAGEGHQTNLRKTGTQTIAVSIEPSGSITDPGDSGPTAPTGTSADWSGASPQSERTLTTSLSKGSAPAAGSKVWMVELSDAFFVVVTEPTNTYQAWILHAGRIATSISSADAVSAGQDGLGFIGGIPNHSDGGTNDWIGTTVPCCTIHWATGEWSDHIAWQVVAASALVANPADTAYRPLCPLLWKAYNINGSWSNQVYGPPKYLRGSGSGEVPKTIHGDTASDQGWIHYNDASGAGYETHIWDKTVTP